MALTTAIDWVKRRGVGILLIFGLAGAAGAGIAVWKAVTVRTAALTILNHHEAVRNLSVVVAGVIAIGLAYWRARVAEHQAETARRSLLNERDQKAAEMLGSTLLSVRLGGIYALQTLAAEHSHYHLGVMRQFCSFVREQGSTAAGTAPEPAREDVRAVMDAIAARSDAGIAVEQKEKGFRLDLRGANLREWRFSEANLFGANLFKADLSGAVLGGLNLSVANLSGAVLFGANLSGANLSVANLSGANLSGAVLGGANLGGANLSGANLSGAKANRSLGNLLEADSFGAALDGAPLPETNLSEANLSGANLSGADLDGCNVSRARFSAGTVITQEQLDQTHAEPPEAEEEPIFVDDVHDAKTNNLLQWRRRRTA